MLILLICIEKPFNINGMKESFEQVIIEGKFTE